MLIFLFQKDLSEQSKILQEVILISIDSKYLKNANHLIVLLVDHLMEDRCV